MERRTNTCLRRLFLGGGKGWSIKTCLRQRHLFLGGGKGCSRKRKRCYFVLRCGNGDAYRVRVIHTGKKKHFELGPVIANGSTEWGSSTPERKHFEFSSAIANGSKLWWSRSLFTDSDIDHSQSGKLDCQAQQPGGPSRSFHPHPLLLLRKK